MAEFIPLGIGGLSARPTTVRKKASGTKTTGGRTYERSELMPPPRPLRNVIPEQSVIENLIERALAALARGIYWDRGSIINLVL